MLKFSDQIDQISTALAKAQGELQNVHKNAANPFFKSKYADLAEVLNIIRPVMADNGISITQHPSYGEGNVYVTTLVSHSSGQWMQSCLSAPVAKADAQAVGSAVSYCRRYAIASIAMVAQTDDDAEGAVLRSGKDAPVAKKAVEKDEPKVELDAAIVGNLQAAKTLKDLAAVWSAINTGIRHDYAGVKDEIKAKLSEVK